jgi:hypothetical protein
MSMAASMRERWGVDPMAVAIRAISRASLEQDHRVDANARP